ncbi:MAG TPA: NAD-dependent epimerase/dehydratase family protein [Stellaceae bacterium]|nr:NAD-dependent epimerase/dehydratase family protein [Stellaceae bacterium]
MTNTPAEPPTLILGGDGFLGRNLAAYFARNGMPFVAIGRAAGDLRDREVVLRLFAGLPRVERILHVATFQRTGQRQYEIPADLLDTNMRIHLNVLEAWARHQPQAKLISTGSSCFYPEHDEPIPERMFQAGPLHDSVRAYGLAKQALAVGSEAYGMQYGLKWLHCVLATTFGPFDHLETDRSHFIGGMAARAIREQREGRMSFTVWGSPDIIRECLYVDDQIEAILAADNLFENMIVNCGANRPVSIDEVATGILRALDWRASVDYPEGTFRGTSRKVLDSTRFLEATGWSPRIGLDEGLQRLVRDLKTRV